MFQSLFEDQIVFDDYYTAREYYTQSIKNNTKCPSLYTIDGYFIPGSLYPFIWTSDLLSISSNGPKFKIKLESESEKINNQEKNSHNYGCSEDEDEISSTCGDAGVLDVVEKIVESPEDDSFLNRSNISNFSMIVLISSYCLISCFIK